MAESKSEVLRPHRRCQFCNFKFTLHKKAIVSALYRALFSCDSVKKVGLIAVVFVRWIGIVMYFRYICRNPAGGFLRRITSKANF